MFAIIAMFWWHILTCKINVDDCVCVCIYIFVLHRLSSIRVLISSSAVTVEYTYMHAHTHACTHMHMHTCMDTHMHIHIVVMCGIIYTSCGVLRHFWEESYLNCCIPLICSRLEPASMAKCHFVTFSAVYCDCRHFLPALCFLRQ